MSSCTANPIIASHFDLVIRNGKSALVYIARHGHSSRNGGVPINWVDLKTGTKISSTFLDLGTLNPLGHSIFPPVDFLKRDIGFSKDGRYLATVTLKKRTARTSTRRGDRGMHTPVLRGAHHNREMYLIIGEIKGRIYRVFVHDM